MLYDLTTLQREANNRYGFSARRTLAAAQRLYEEHKALTYPRTNSRYLTTDMVDEIKPIAELVGKHSEYAKGAAYVTALDVLPLGRVVNDEKVSDHHAIIPTRSEHNLEKMGSDDRRVYDMAVRRFLAVFHPEAVFENTRVETTVASAGEGTYLFRTRGKLLLVPGWRGVYDEVSADDKAAEAEARAGEDEEGTDQQLPRLIADEEVQTRKIESARKETKPPRRYSDASLLGAMETAGKLVDDDELREAMKDSGIGTPATRAAIIERLITVGYVERDGRALVATEKGLNVIRLLNEHALTSPGLTGNWEQRLGKIERGEDSRKKFMSDIAGFAEETVKQLDETLKDVRIPRARLGPCPVCGHEIVENRKGYSCWAREDPGCGFVIWKSKAGKTLPIAIAKELIKTGYTAQAVTGFRGRSGRSFRAHLALQQTEEGKWRVEFDELWAKEGAKAPEGQDEASGGGEASGAATAPPREEEKRSAA
jgi:DNA topoisomerase-3